MIDVTQKPRREDHHPDFDPQDAAGPVGGGGGAVAGEPAADAGRVDELEGEGREPDAEVDGRHAGVEDEWCEERAVDVVDCLCAPARGQRTRRESGIGGGDCGVGRGAYEEGGHDPVGLREMLDAELLRQCEHYVEEDHEAGRFHCGPADGAGDVEARVDGCLALGVEIEEPLYNGELGGG